MLLLTLVASPGVNKLITLLRRMPNYKMIYL